MNYFNKGISNKNLLIDKLSEKTTKLVDLEFVDFIKELNKVIKKVGIEKLSTMQELDWMEGI